MGSKELKDSLIMLQIIALGNLDVSAGRTKPLKQAFAEHRERVKIKYPELSKSK